MACTPSRPMQQLGHTAGPVCPYGRKAKQLAQSRRPPSPTVRPPPPTPCRGRKWWESESLCLACMHFSMRSYRDPDFKAREARVSLVRVLCMRACVCVSCACVWLVCMCVCVCVCVRVHGVCVVMGCTGHGAETTLSRLAPCLSCRRAGSRDGTSESVVLQRITAVPFLPAHVKLSFLPLSSTPRLACCCLCRRPSSTTRSCGRPWPRGRPQHAADDGLRPAMPVGCVWRTVDRGSSGGASAALLLEAGGPWRAGKRLGSGLRANANLHPP